ncbi:P10 [Rachiplusia nu nucleopolyhedrovirus]|uniref:P10 n=1 Tax=Rachiplusia nu nucleopolyhedrovirus TaxID=2605775 RepID=A0AAF1DB45_9ABAC|nr:P10 [Rachiplusia nu nucleopolyhedrovirus]QEI03644.1 P10 [Rachiplusia nu nucleopolyhedrovirus]
MSQNILLLIRSDIKDLDAKVDTLQTAIEDVRANLPDVAELTDKIDAQITTLSNLQTVIDRIDETLNPEIPDVPDVPTVRNNKKKVTIAK